MECLLWPWKDLFKRPRLVRSLPDDEMQEASQFMQDMSSGMPCTKYNCTIRWHERHMTDCPMAKDAASFAASGSQAKESSVQPAQKEKGSSSKAALPENAEAMEEEKAVKRRRLAR